MSFQENCLEEQWRTRKQLRWRNAFKRYLKKQRLRQQPWVNSNCDDWVIQFKMLFFSATDAGKEFIGNKSFFKKNHIYFQLKRGLNKAAFAEGKYWKSSCLQNCEKDDLFWCCLSGFIKILKRRLYIALREKRTEDWISLLQQTIYNINNSPKDALGGIRPITITGPVDDIRIDEAKAQMTEKSSPVSKKKTRRQPLNVGNIILPCVIQIKFIFLFF